MERLFLAVALICTAHASQDLSEKIFTFPLGVGTGANVKLITTAQVSITASTICMRYHSSKSQIQALFSVSFPSQISALQLIKSSSNVYRIHVNGRTLEVSGMPDNNNDWNSVCLTWSSSYGLTTLWVNGKRSDRTVLAQAAVLTGSPTVFLGSSGSGRLDSQSFQGDITDFHFWDKVISPCEIQFYMEGNSTTAGNLFSWKSLQYTISGIVYVEKSDFDKLLCQH